MASSYLPLLGLARQDSRLGRLGRNHGSRERRANSWFQNLLELYRLKTLLKLRELSQLFLRKLLIQGLFGVLSSIANYRESLQDPEFLL
jgi:hypothetical protein